MVPVKVVALSAAWVFIARPLIFCVQIPLKA
jgi:hypothetical protein